MESILLDDDQDTAATGTGSVDKTMTILEYIASNKSDVGVTEIARALQMNKSRVHRVLTTMARGGFVEHDLGTRRYRMGWKLFRLALMISSQNSLISQADPLMRSLVEATRGTALLYVLLGSRIMVSHVVESPLALKVTLDVGDQKPFYFGAPGKVLSAHLETQEIDQLVAQGISGLTRNTTTDPAAFMAQLNAVRHDGFAFSDEETASGVVGIASPIRDCDGKVVAALSLAMPKVHLPANMVRETIELVKRTAGEISHCRAPYVDSGSLASAYVQSR